MNRAIRWTASACALAAAGCGGEETPSWTYAGGTDAEIQVAWTINGAAATSTACASVGGASVRLYLDRSDPLCPAGEPGCGLTDPAWSWDCSGGAGTTGRIFARQRLAAAIVLHGPGGEIRRATTWGEYDLPAGILTLTAGFRLPVITGPDAHVAGAWTIDGAPADAATCDAAGGATVSLAYRLAGSAVDQRSSWPCADGSGATETIFRSGTAYELRWELLDAAGADLSSHPTGAAWLPTTPSAGNNPFDVPFVVRPVLRGPLEAALRWADAATDPTFGGCTAPSDAVARVGYRLETPAGTTIDEVDIATAPLDCAPSLSWPDLPFGMYRLIVDGESGDGAVRWRGECAGIVVDNALSNAASCDVPMAPSP